MVGCHKLWTLFAFHLLLFFYGDYKIIAVDTLQNAFHLLAVGIEHFYWLANEAVVLLWHLEWLSETCRAYFELIVFFVAAEMVFDIAAQRHAIFYPHSIGMVDLYYDSVIRAYLYVDEEIFLAVKPLFNN